MAGETGACTQLFLQLIITVESIQGNWQQQKQEIWGLMMGTKTLNLQSCMELMAEAYIFSF